MVSSGQSLLYPVPLLEENELEKRERKQKERRNEKKKEIFSD
jgi:hypothetical protein